MTQDELLRRYFLGDSPPDERTKIEEECAVDADRFEELVEAENDLIDSYVRGALPESERRKFELQYLGSPDGIDRVGFARTLAGLVELERKPAAAASATPWMRLRTFFMDPILLPSWVPLGAVALVLAVLALGLQDYGMHRQLSETRADAAQLRRQHEALRAQLDNLAAASGHQSEEKPPDSQVAQLEPQGDLHFLLVPGIVRGGVAARQKDLEISQNRTYLRLEMSLDRDEYQTYEAVLETPDSKEVLRGKTLKSHWSGRNHFVSWRFPLRLIHFGDFVVVLKGQNEKGILDPVQSYSFRAVYKP